MDFLFFAICVPVFLLSLSLGLAYLMMNNRKGASQEQLFWKRVDYGWFSATTITFFLALLNAYQLSFTKQIEFYKQMEAYSVDAIRLRVAKAYNQECLEPLLQHVRAKRYTRMPDSEGNTCEEIRHLNAIVSSKELNRSVVYLLDEYVNKPLTHSHMQSLQAGLKIDLSGYTSWINKIETLDGKIKFMHSPEWITAFYLSLWLLAVALGFRLIKVHAEVLMEERKAGEKGKSTPEEASSNDEANGANPTEKLG